MFRCEKCGTAVKAGVPTTQLVVAQRPKEYPTRTREVIVGRGRRPWRQTIDKGGEGREIVRELSVCPSCAERFGKA